MRIATILFTYNRSEHTKMVLDSMAKNKKHPEKLYIFQDGLKKEEHREEWDKVNSIIKNVEFCDTECFVSYENKGLAKSIVQGINKAFESCDAVIVVEDDCVLHPSFMNFMEQAFEKYNDIKDVFSISGYAWPINVKNDEYDAYFSGRFSSWGWGTWKDRWELYNQDFKIMDEISNNYTLSKSLACWGKDLEPMLLDRFKGKNDSWAVFWALKVISKNGRCVSPYRTLVKNIGHDGSGTHCKKNSKYDVEFDDVIIDDFRFPDSLEYRNEIKKGFCDLMGSCFYESSGNLKGEHVIVYGAGGYFRKNEKYVYENFYVDAIIDKDKKGYYGEIPIFGLNKINQFVNSKIIIAIESEQICSEIEDMLVKQFGIKKQNIFILYRMMEC